MMMMMMMLLVHRATNLSVRHIFNNLRSRVRPHGQSHLALQVYAMRSCKQPCVKERRAKIKMWIRM